MQRLQEQEEAERILAEQRRREQEAERRKEAELRTQQQAAIEAMKAKNQMLAQVKFLIINNKIFNYKIIKLIKGFFVCFNIFTKIQFILNLIF